MREMAQVVAWSAAVVVIGWFLTAGLDLLMGVHLFTPNLVVRAMHKFVYMVWGGTCVWLWYKIFQK